MKMYLLMLTQKNGEKTIITIKKNQKGFTLIELMIVVAIIGILAAIAVPNFISYRNKAKVSTALETASSIRGAISGYAADSIGNSFPTEALIPDGNWEALRLTVNKNGGTLKPTAAEQGFIGSTIDYTATSDSAEVAVIDNRELILFVAGIPESILGHKIVLSSSGIAKQSGT